MPDSTSRFDDPFADLFGKLPDPRSRGDEAPDPRRMSASETEDVADAPAQSTVDAAAEDAPASASPTPASGTGGAAAASAGAAPISRRAAREAMRAHAPQPAAGAGAVGASAAAVPETRTAVLTGPVPNAEREDAPALANLEDLFMGTRSSDEIGDVPPPPNRRRRRIGGWIALGDRSAALRRHRRGRSLRLDHL